MKAVGTNIIFEKKEENENTVGVIETFSSKKNFESGEVISIGDQVKLNIKEGDTIYYFAERKIPLDNNFTIDEKYIIARG